MYVIIRLWMTSIKDLINQNCLSYLPLNLKICHIWLCLRSSICKYWPTSTKLGHNIYAHRVSDEFDSGTNRIGTSGVICPWIWKNCWIWLYLHSSIYKYWPISTKLGQNVCGLKTPNECDYGSNRTRTLWVICPMNSKIFYIWFCLHSSICKYWPISTKLGHNIYAHKVSDEFDSWTNRIRISKVICPWIGKIIESDCVYTLASTNIDQSTPNLVKIYMTIRLRMSLIMDLIGLELYELSALEFENLPYLTLFTLYHLQISTNQYQIGHNIYAHIVSDEFDYWTNRTRTSWVICPLIGNNCWIWLFTLQLLQILTNQHQTWSKCIWPLDLGWVWLWM